MKTIPYIISAILAVCVAVLFYQVQSLKSATPSAAIEKPTDNAVKQDVQAVVNNSKLPETRIAYVNIDSLNDKYLYISENEKVLKGRQQALEATIRTLTQKLQEDYAAAQQSAQAGIMPPAELEAKKAQLERQEREIESKQVQMENLAMEMQEKTEKMKAEIKRLLMSYYKDKYDYILTYSSTVPTILLANPSFEITSQVVEMLNAEYKNKKSEKK